MKKLLIFAAILLTCCKEDSNPVSPEQADAKPPAIVLLQNNFQQRVDSILPFAKRFIASKGFNKDIAFIADLSMHSGIERMAIVDLRSDSVIAKGLVAHGAGGRFFSDTARYSNVANSLCSSPGIYRIGAKYNGRFGKAYKLHGLDKSNDKAFERFVVLHGYDCVPDATSYPEFLCNSEGCPMVSYHFLDILSGFIDKSRRPVLLWILG